MFTAKVYTREKKFNTDNVNAFVDSRFSTAVSLGELCLKEPNKHFLGIVLKKAQKWLVPAVTRCHSS